MTNIVNLGQAEQKARLRDFEIEREKLKQERNGVEQEEIDNSMQVLRRVTGGKDILLVTKRKPQSKVKFAQFIQDNWNYAIKNKIFTNEEMLFLLRIQGFLQFKSNCIVDDIHSKSAVPMSQKQIAEELGTSNPKVSKIVKGLVEKGVIIKATGQKIEGVNARTYALFINPNIICCGERDNIEVTLKTLFMNAKPLLKNFPVALF